MNTNTNTNTRIKLVWSIASTILVAIVMLIAMFLMGMRLMGLNAYTVLSGSMEPQYSVGDLIYVKDVDPSEIQVGDAITFVMNEQLTVATHQVISIDEEKQHFYTQGLANDTPDASPVHFKNLIGKPVFSLPLLGYASSWMQNPPGTYITIALGALLIAIVFLPDMLKKKKKAEDVAVAESEELIEMRRQLEEMKAQLEEARSASAESEADRAPENAGEER